MKAQKKSISFDVDTFAILENRGGDNLSGRVQTVAHAYADLMRIGFRTLRRTLTGDEARLILDTMNGAVMIMPGSSLEHWITGGIAMTGQGPDAREVPITSGIEHNVSDAIALDHLDEKWQVNGPALIAKLRALDRLALAALLDWCQIMWDRHRDTDFWTTELAKFQPSMPKNP